MAKQLWIGTVRKGPTEVLDYTENWSDILGPIDDVIVDLSCEVDGDMVVSGEQFTEADTTIWLSGGTAGRNYTASFTVHTDAGRVFRRSIRVVCVQR